MPIAAEFDESGEFPHKTIKKMGEMGFMGIEISEEYGGAGMDTLAYVPSSSCRCSPPWRRSSAST
jgi:alkylation response protein AidB-like acyl-CoA dehydrogenase